MECFGLVCVSNRQLIKACHILLFSWSILPRYVRKHSFNVEIASDAFLMQGLIMPFNVKNCYKTGQARR